VERAALREGGSLFLAWVIRKKKRATVNVPDVTAFDDPDGQRVANSRETTMWNVLMVGYWACVAIPLVFLCAGIVTAFRGVARQSDAPDRWGS
jgi:hypothetical protein